MNFRSPKGATPTKPSVVLAKRTEAETSFARKPVAFSGLALRERSPSPSMSGAGDNGNLTRQS
jgi:hypothetical protein